MFKENCSSRMQENNQIKMHQAQQTHALSPHAHWKKTSTCSHRTAYKYVRSGTFALLRVLQSTYSRLAGKFEFSSGPRFKRSFPLFLRICNFWLLTLNACMENAGRSQVYVLPFAIEFVCHTVRKGARLGGLSFYRVSQKVNPNSLPNTLDFYFWFIPVKCHWIWDSISSLGPSLASYETGGKTRMKIRILQESSKQKQSRRTVLSAIAQNSSWG